jgi:hypothetical protein
MAEPAIVTLLVDSCPSALLEVDYKGRSPDDILVEIGKRKIKGSAGEIALMEVDAIRQLLLKALEKYELLDMGDTTTEKDEVESHLDLDLDYHEHVPPENKASFEQTSHGTPESAIMERDYDRQPTILTKLLEEKRWEEAVQRCKKYPKEVSTWMCRYEQGRTVDGRPGDKILRWKILPIHSAVVLNAPKKVLKSIIDTYPSGVYQGDDRDMLPIHMAFRLAADLDICKLLVHAYPKSLQHPDRNGVTPKDILMEYRQDYRKAQRLGQSMSASDMKRQCLFEHFLVDEVGTKKGTYATKGKASKYSNDMETSSKKSESPRSSRTEKENKTKPKKESFNASSSVSSPIESIILNQIPSKKRTETEYKNKFKKESRSSQSAISSPIESIILSQINQHSCMDAAAIDFAPSRAFDDDDDDDYDEDEDDYDEDSVEDSIDDETSSHYSSKKDPDALFYKGMFEDIGLLTLGGLPDMFLCGNGRRH